MAGGTFVTDAVLKGIRSTEAMVFKSLVATVRANTSLKSQLSGGIHESIAPVNTDYPFLTITMVAAPSFDDWSSRLIVSMWDISVWAEDPVEASTLDSLVAGTLEDRLQPVQGQTVLYCRRTAGLRLPEVTEEGKLINRVGGTYSIWTNQPSP